MFDSQTKTQAAKRKQQDANSTTAVGASIEEAFSLALARQQDRLEASSSVKGNYEKNIKEDERHLVIWTQLPGSLQTSISSIKKKVFYNNLIF